MKVRVRSKLLGPAIVAALASLALLAPVGSAQAASPHGAPLCAVYPGATPLTLKPGQRCSFYPIATRGYWASYHAVGNGHYSGVVCAGITRYPPSNSNTPLNDSGQPGSWNCNPASWTNDQSWNTLAHFVNNAFGAVYGQATIVNFSTATIRFAYPSGCDLGNLNNCVYYYA